MRLALLAGMSLCISCGEETLPLNVLLIGVDTLRPDHLGCYGYDRDTSPSIDRLAAAGVLCENAVSQSPWTTPSFGTAFTSLYPTQHGAGSLESRLRTESTTLAEVLLGRGYATGAIVSSPSMSPEFGLDRGFESYDICYEHEGRLATEATEIALEWLDANSSKPFFLFVHYFDPHLTYRPPPPYDTMFDPEYRGDLGNSFGRTAYPQDRDGGFRSMRALSDEDWNHIKSLYDGEIAFTDRAIGELLAGLSARGLEENTLVVFISDHGEEFFEHDGFRHGHTLFDELIRVPFVFRLPNVLPHGARIKRQVRVLDVMPTVLDILRIEADMHMEGISLAGLLTGKSGSPEAQRAVLPPEAAFAEALLRGPEQKSITVYPHKLIYNTLTEEEMLFDLEVDPGEKHDISESQSDVRHRMEDRLFKALLDISDTWYVEMAGGSEGSIFDLRIEAKSTAGGGGIRFLKLLDRRNAFVAGDDVPAIVERRNTVVAEALDLNGLLTLAFKTNPHTAPLTFDLRIDGESPPAGVYLGRSLEAPAEIPFVLARETALLAEGVPKERPVPPYILIWHPGGKYASANRVRLNEKVKKELRALGYMQ